MDIELENVKDFSCYKCGKNEPEFMNALKKYLDKDSPMLNHPFIAFDQIVHPLFNPSPTGQAPAGGRGFLVQRDICGNCGAEYITRTCIIKWTDMFPAQSPIAIPGQPGMPQGRQRPIR